MAKSAIVSNLVAAVDKTAASQNGAKKGDKGSEIERKKTLLNRDKALP
jgi:hypothetical protein